MESVNFAHSGLHEPGSEVDCVGHEGSAEEGAGLEESGLLVEGRRGGGEERTPR